ncbi:hypothetical protein, partial [Thermogutta sp.]|uniref:hypothetical protein n=1 Tax=Thermogutta sp. TaxID=1962930 RepID=UPI003C7D1882
GKPRVTWQERTAPMATPQGPSVPPPGVTVSCPHCGVALQIPASQAGAICACPVCQGKFQAPVPSALPAGVGLVHPEADRA